MPLDWDDIEDETAFEPRLKTNKVHEEVTTPYATVSDGSPPEHRSLLNQGYLPATLTERFTAGCVDIFIIYLFNIFLNIILPMLLTNLDYFKTIKYFFLFMFAFGYYTLSEAILAKTLGKHLCHLQIICVEQKKLEIKDYVLRNIMRIVDYFLFPLAIISIENSPYAQRLGDYLAKTIVVKRPHPYHAVVDLRRTSVTSTLMRSISHGIDTCIILILLYCYLLSLPQTWPIISKQLFVNFWILYFLYYILNEYLFETTPGKYLLGRRIVMENGERIQLPAVFIRNLWRPLDCILAPLTILLSKNKQRLGDMLAQTLVLHTPLPSSSQKLFFWNGMVMALLILFAWLNPSPYQQPQDLKKYFSLPKLQISKPTHQAPTLKINSLSLPSNTNTQLKISDFYFASGPGIEAVHKDGTFFLGEPIFVFFKLSGMSSKQVHILEKLKIYNDAQELILDNANFYNVSKTLGTQETDLLVPNQIKLPQNIDKGNYRLVFTLIDQNNKTELHFEKTLILN